MSGNDIYENSDPEFVRRVQQMIAASGGRITIISAFRSVERQQQLWNNAVRKYGSEAAARKWVAPPGRSNHNRGVAMDLRYASNEAREWAHDNAGRFGLTFPMDHEPWHIEPLGVRDGSWSRDVPPDPEAYTTPPPGIPMPGEKPKGLADHMFSLHEMLLNPSRFNDGDHEGDIGTPMLPVGQRGKAVGSLGLKGKQVEGEDKSLLGYSFEDLTGMEISDASTS